MAVHIMDHPLIQHKLTILRDKDTKVKDFRDVVSEVAMLMCYEATRDLPLMGTVTETPVAMANTKAVAGMDMALIPILRAGLGMLEGILTLIPWAKVGHIGLYRDHNTLQPVEYYCKLPEDISKRECIILDPMLATGGSSVAAVKLLQEKGADKIKLMCIIAAPEGIELMQKECPEVDIFCAALDDHLNELGYIVPGLGDAGDRIFGTK
jgi:uracil phosphoribosyltransferase